MKILIDVKDSKAAFFLELLRHLPFVKAEKISPGKSHFLKEVRGSVNEVIQAKKGKVKLKKAEQLLNEL